jgi:DNA-binding PadR family transcriptional regulator
MSLRHALLGLLVDRSASGYDLMKLFDTSLANVWPATQSQVYGELARLAENELIAVTAEGPRGRKEYSITGAGMNELRQWLATPAPIQPRRSDMLLRVFFLNVTSPEVARGYLEGRRQLAHEQHERLKQLEAAIDWEDGDLSVNGRLALEYGLRLSAMEEAWADWARDRIGGEPRPRSADATDASAT